MRKLYFVFIFLISFANYLQAQVTQADFDALVAIYNSTDGNNWTDKSNWDINATKDDVNSTWYGIIVSVGRVTEIDLRKNNLIGNLPAELGDLTALTSLNMRENTIGSLPVEIGNLTALTYLMFNYNEITEIPSSIGNLTALQELSIGQNKLSVVPDEVFSLTQLSTLNIGYNQLTAVSTGIGNLTALTTLFMSGNQLTALPSEIGDLGNLQYLYIENNQITGLPSTIGNLSSLVKFIADHNELASLPAEIGGLSSIDWLYLNSNKLTDLPAEINNITTVTRLVLDSNQLGNLPPMSALANLGMFYLNDNILEFGDLETANVNWAAISYRDYSPQADIQLAKTGSNGNTVLTCSVSGSNNQYKWYRYGIEMAGETSNSITITSSKGGIYYCEVTDPNFPDLTISSSEESVNESHGVLVQDYDALIAIYDATAGDNWGSKTNWKSEEDVSTWYGIIVSSGRVKEIDLSFNNLVGNLPVELGDLTGLTYLNMRNDTIGSLPVEIGNLTALTYLMFNYNKITEIPSSIGNLTVLQELSIGQNKLSVVPDEVFSLTQLSTLNIGYNQLTAVPTGIGNLTALTTLFVSGNQLTALPSEIGNLGNLQYLYIENNQITGLPSTIGNLTSLLRFIADHNELASLPAEIGGLSSIDWLYLNNNKLTDLPAEINNITTVTRLVLDNSQLGDLPIMSALTNLGMLYLNDNALEFDDLEIANVDWSTIGLGDYSPQAKIGEVQEIVKNIGDDVYLVVGTEGNNNNYKWYKDNVEIANSNNDTLTINDFSADDKGQYFCEITNDDFPSLTLETETYQLIVTGIGSVINDVKANVYPNPSDGRFMVSLEKLVGKNMQIEISDLSGKLIYHNKINGLKTSVDINSIPAGVYIMKIKADNTLLGIYKIITK